MVKSSGVVGMVAERVALDGVGSLSDRELLDLVAGRPVPLPAGSSPLDGARMTPVMLREGLGLSTVTAHRIAAAFELGRRASARPGATERILDPEKVARLMADVADLPVECFWTLTLDVRARLLGRHQIAQGHVSACPVQPRDVLSPAVREHAHGVIFVHNHPSGDPSPSAEDVDLTARLRAAAEVLGIAARDHVIVARGGARYSFVEAGTWRR